MSGQKKEPVVVGERFGRLVVTSTATERKGPHRRCECRCDCGNVVSLLTNNIKRRGTQSCGCLRREATSARRTTHGKRLSRAYSVWRDIQSRCENENGEYWDRYGGRGIKVCDRWRESFENFYADMGDPPVGLTIDRINNDGDYEPGNCRWATRTEQARNKSSNKIITIRGESKPLVVWVEECGADYDLVYLRIRRGWSAERALTTPAIKKAATVAELVGMLAGAKS